MKKLVFTAGLFAFTLLFGALSEKSVADAVMDYYLENLGISQDRLHLRITHFPDTQRLPEDLYRLTVEDDGPGVKLGHRTLKLIVWKQNRILKKYPVSVDAAVYKDVLVTKIPVSRNTPVSEDNVEIRRVLLDRGVYDVTDGLKDVEGLLFARPLSRDRVVLRSSLKEPADVLYGDRVQIQLVNGPMVLAADGKILGEARIGDEVIVKMEATGKRMTGILLSADLVRVDQ